jgi:phosphonoacetaldehyde hydrolase
VKKGKMMSKISAVVLDWAGTTVDFGCFAPVDAFAVAFDAFGITPTIEETRAPMGLPKRAHIEKMLGGGRLSVLWSEVHGAPYTQADIDNIYAEFEPALFRVLSAHAEPLPGVSETLREIRERGVSIGSTTGYTRAMMDMIAPLAAGKGFAPDCIVCPDDTDGIGRPFPYMLWRNLEKLKTLSVSEVLKIGDTAADISVGKNAGCLSVGVIKGSSMLGLDADGYARMDAAEKAAGFAETERKYREAGADFVLNDITELPELIRRLENHV